MVQAKGGYDTVKIDVTQTPDQHGPTTAIPVRPEKWHQGARWRGSRSGPLRGKSNRYAQPIQPALHPA